MNLTRCLSLILLAVSILGFTAINYMPSLGIETGSLNSKSKKVAPTQHGEMQRHIM